MDKNVKYAVIGLVGAIAVQQAVIGYQAIFIERQNKRAKMTAALSDYLLDVMIRNETTIDEFDEIVIRDIIG